MSFLTYLVFISYVTIEKYIYVLSVQFKGWLYVSKDTFV